MVKVHLVFKGETMAEVREALQEWAREFSPAIVVGDLVEVVGSNAHAGVQGAPPMPPKTRSYKKRKVESPLPAEEAVATPPSTPPVGSVQGLLDPAPVAEAERNDEAVTAAAIRFAEKYGKAALRTLLVEQFQVTRARDIEPAKQVAFITACARGPQ